MKVSCSGCVSTVLRAYTLIEVLVVCFIIAFLAAIIIPAISSVRESSRRLECVNHLKQLSLAEHSLLSARGTFSVPMPFRIGVNGKSRAAFNTLSGNFELLPFLELNSLYNTINLGSLSSRPVIVLSPQNRANQTAYSSQISVFMCPSETLNVSVAASVNAYRFNVGNANPLVVSRASSIGAFDPVLPASSAEYVDGLSTTVGMSERIVGGQMDQVFVRNRDVWCAGVLDLIDVRVDDNTLKVCRALISNPSEFITTSGSTWMLGGAPYLWYNHVAPPNDRWADCATSSDTSSNPFYCHTCSIAARSFHPRGINVSMMDGSVRFVSDSIALSVWRALGSRAGGESVGTNW